MNSTLYMAIPPNIARHTRTELERLFPELDLAAPDIHREMYDFALTFGQADLPALSVSAYPQMVENALALSRTGRLARPAAELPALRPELAALGLAPPAPELVVIAVVPCVLAVNQAWPAIADWADLAAPELWGRVGVPPRDTPLPYLVEAHLSGLQDGRSVDGLLDTRSTPLDINKRVDSGELAAGVLIPAFGRASRGGGARLVWPQSGALAVPLVACLRGDAPAAAHSALEYLLSFEFQSFLAMSGGIAPVRDDVPGFRELNDASWNLQWPGWAAVQTVARNMNAALTA